MVHGLSGPTHSQHPKSLSRSTRSSEKRGLHSILKKEHRDYHSPSHVRKEGKICHSGPRQRQPPTSSSTKATHAPTHYQHLWSPSHLTQEKGRTGLSTPELRLNMTPQAEAKSPPQPPPTGSPDLFSRPRPRPPRSPSQAAKIRVQNRRRQYLENNPDYLSSADNQLAGKPQVIPAP